MTRTRKNKWLNRGLVYGPHFTLCTTEADYRREVKRLTTKPDPNDAPDAWCPPGRACVHTLDQHDKTGMACIVCIDVAGIERDKTSPEVVVAMLVHEATHIKQQFMTFIGERAPSAEFEAYVMQNLTRSLLDEYARQANLPTPAAKSAPKPKKGRGGRSR